MTTISSFRPASWTPTSGRVGARSPHPVVVRPSHDLDLLSGQHLVSTLSRITAHAPVPEVHLILSRVTFADVAGVRALLACREVARARGAELVLVDPSPAVRRILAFTPALREQLEGKG